MRTVTQRVQHASVTIDGQLKSKIGKGLLVLVGIEDKDIAIPMYKAFCEEVGLQLGKPVQTGTFGADMKIELLNDGPVTIIIDSQNKE